MNQQTKVYAAEVAAKWKHNPYLQPKSIDKIQTYVDSILKSDWFDDMFPRFHGGVVVKKTKLRAGRADGSLILLPEWTWDLSRYILHELAHCISPMTHDPEFVNTYLRLTWMMEGRDEGNKLWGAMRAKKVVIANEQELAKELSRYGP